MNPLWLAAALLQGGAAVDETRDVFREWQMRMLRERTEPTESLRRILSRKTAVPPPPSEDTPERPPVLMDFGTMDPLGLLPAPVISSRIDDPKVRVKFQTKVGLFDLWAFEHKRLLWTSVDDGTEAFGDAETLGGLDVGKGNKFRPFSKVLFGVAGHEIAVDGPKAGVEWKGVWFGGEVNVDHKGKLEGQVSVGPDLVPKALHGVAEARVQLTAEISAPVVVQDVQWRSKWGASQVASGAAAAAALWVRGQQSCAYCSGTGAVACRQCAGKHVVDCPTCKRAGRLSCSACGGRGQLSCPTTRSCGRCSGSGVERCGSCSGSGSQTVYDTVPATETRWLSRPVTAGFDSKGNPILKMERYSVEVETTKTVSRRVSCGSCGGSGRGGSCGRCGGDGSVACGKCSGSGRIPCDDCDGVGSKTCRTCEGSLEITCPTCRRRAFECPICKGKGAIGR